MCYIDEEIIIIIFVVVVVTEKIPTMLTPNSQFLRPPLRPVDSSHKFADTQLEQDCTVLPQIILQLF